MTRSATSETRSARRKRARARALVSRIAAVVVSIALATIGVVVVPLAADAAPGPGTMSVSLTPVHYLTGDPIAATAYGLNGDKLAYRVNYTCSVANCDAAQVKIGPMQQDPFGFGQQLLKYNTWTRPSTAPATGNPTGTDLAGWTFALGALPAGTSGSFLVTYDIEALGAYTTVRPGSYFPNGFQIIASATMSAGNTVGDASATSAPVTWGITIPDPGVNIGGPTSVQPNTMFYLPLAMGSGEMVRYNANTVTGSSQYLGAAAFVNVLHLPVGAVIAGPIPDNGVYDSGARTITWSRGSATSPDPAAAAGWGSASTGNWSGRGVHYFRQLPISFDPALFPGADANGCNFEATPQFTFDTSVTYLDSARTVKAATISKAITVSCYEPFGTATFAKDASGSAVGAERQIAAPTGADGSGAWSLFAYNEGNVPADAVVEDTFPDATLPVNQVGLTRVGTIEYSLDNGTSASMSGASFIAPAGTRITWVRITWSGIPAGRVRPVDTGSTLVRANLFFRVPLGTPVGTLRSNTATMSMTWPGTTLAPSSKSATRNVRIINSTAAANPGFALLNSLPAPAVQGGGQAVPGRNVTFTVDGTITNLPAGHSTLPEYVFIAPIGWTINSGSAAMDAGAPAGVNFRYLTVPVGGVPRDVVVATWPGGTSFTDFANLPAMTVVARPTALVAAGTVSVADLWLGDSTRQWVSGQANYAGAKQNVDDVDRSGQTDAWFASRTLTATVSAADGMNVVKEICLPDPSAADGCAWTSDSTTPVRVPINSASIQYRVTIANTGNTTLNNVVAYDVLPYVGDTGLIAATAATPRGSTFAQSLVATSKVSANLTLSYSASRNPSRPEVSAAGGVDDWAAGPAAGMVAIRAAVAGALSPGSSASFVYAAAVAAGSSADAIACNSVAFDSDKTLPSEPAPVCAMTSEADLQVTSAGAGSASYDGQIGRPVTVPFVLSNLGGSANAAARVEFDVPAGATVRTADLPGFTCDKGTDVLGPATITCTSTTALNLGAPATASLVVIPSLATVTLSARISGPIYDPVATNNAATATISASAAAGALGLTKSDGVTGAVVGQTLTYTLRLSNPLTTESLTGLVVTDALPTGLTYLSAAAELGTLDVTGNSVRWSVPTLAPSRSVWATVTAVVDGSATGLLVNTATASAPDPGFAGRTLNASAPDTTGIDGIALIKSGSIASTGKPKAGDVVTFTFVATNAGQGTVTGVAVSDPMPGLAPITMSWPGTPGELRPTESATGTATYVLAQRDIDRGSLTNGATVVATSAGGAATSATAATTVPILRSPAIALTKSASAPRSTLGDPVTYTFEARNTGNVTLSGVTLTDAMPGLSTIALTWPGATGVLAPGDVVTGTAVRATTRADLNTGSLTNSATVSGSGPAGSGSASATAQTTVTFAQNPVLTLAKVGTVANPTQVVVGSVVTFTFEVVNTGNVTITGVTLSDPMPGLSAIGSYVWPAATGTLEPGQRMTAVASYPVTAADLDRGSVRNTATVLGTAPGGTPRASDTSLVPLIQDPRVSFAKTASTAFVDGVPWAGDPIGYLFAVTNVGNVTVSDVSVSDPIAGLSAIVHDSWPGPVGVLGSTLSTQARASYVLTQDDLDRGTVANTADVTSHGPTGDPADGSSTVTVALPAAPSISFAKSHTYADGGRAAVGAPVRFTFTATNTGNVTLVDLAIADRLTGIGPVAYTWPGAAGTLAPGGTVTATADYQVTQADIDAGRIENSATISGAGVRGGPVVKDATDRVDLGQVDDVSFVKSAVFSGDPASPRAGDVVSYMFTTTNTGNVTISQRFYDDLLPGVVPTDFRGEPGQTDNDLSPGESEWIDLEYVLTQHDLDTRSALLNTGLVTTVGIDGAVLDRSSTHTLPLPAAGSIGLTKSSRTDPATLVVGATATFDIAVVNTGNVTVSDLVITDLLPGASAVVPQAWPGAVGELTPGQRLAATATYVVTQADVDRGRIVNDATADAVPARGAAVSAAGSATIAVPGLAAVTLTKSASLAGGPAAAVGDVVSYDFTITNTGDLSLTGVGVIDHLPGIGVLAFGTWPTAVGELAPGQSVTARATYPIAQADIDAGIVRNTATAIATPARGAVVSDDAQATTALAGSSALSLTKSGTAPARPAAGATATFAFEVTNTGSLTVYDLSITDPLPGVGPVTFGTWPQAAGTLAPGQSVTATAAYPLTQHDLDVGSIHNTATATARASRGAAPSASATATTTVTGVAALTLTKAGSLATSAPVVGSLAGFTFTVVNTGSLTVSGLGITDHLAGVSGITYGPWPGASGVLAPGERVTATADYPLTQQDLLAGQVINSASVAGSATYGPAPSANARTVLALPTRPGTPSAAPADPTGALPSTGTDSARILLIALATLGVGLVLVVATGGGRRRRTTAGRHR